MTLIVAVQYSPGVVMASDSRMVEMGTAVTREVKEKIFRVGGESVVCGGVGDFGLNQRVRGTMQGLGSLTDLEGAREVLAEAINPLLRDASEKHVPVPGQPSAPPIGSYLFAGIFAGVPAILKMEEHGNIFTCGDEWHGFGAVGPYQDRAHLIAQNYLRPECERSESEAKLLAYRVVEDCIRMYGAHLGLPIQLWSVDTERVTEYGTTTLRDLHTRCEKWRNEEQNVFAFVSQST